VLAYSIYLIARSGRLMLAFGAWFGTLRHWLKSKIIGDVPPEYIACEYFCRRTDCTSDEGLSCEKRLAHLKSHWTSLRDHRDL